MKVSKPFVSRILNSCLRSWGWDDSDVYTAQIILLSHCLAGWYTKTNTFKLIKSDRLSQLYPHGIGVPENEFYKKVINAQQTRSYFSDLDISEINLLVGTCSAFHERWYGLRYF